MAARRVAGGALGVLLAGIIAASLAAAGGESSTGMKPHRIAPGIHRIKHVVVIMQENRSFDSYYGTYPGADGIPMKDGVPTVCVPDPQTHQCVKPYHDSQDRNGGGPHGAANATAD